MGSRRKAEKVGYDVGIEDSGDCIQNGAKQLDISARSDVHHISVEATLNFVPFYSPWMSLMLPWPIKRHVFILGDPATPTSILVGSSLLGCGLEHFFTWQKLLQPYKAFA
jgi:hypothetical protein